MLFGDDFGLSDGDLSEEEGNRLYAYLGDYCLSREAVEDLSRELDESYSQPELVEKLVQKLILVCLLMMDWRKNTCFGKSKLSR